MLRETSMSDNECTFIFWSGIEITGEREGLFVVVFGLVRDEGVTKSRRTTFDGLRFITLFTPDPRFANQLSKLVRIENTKKNKCRDCTVKNVKVSSVGMSTYRRLKGARQ